MCVYVYVSFESVGDQQSALHGKGRRVQLRDHLVGNLHPGHSIRGNAACTGNYRYDTMRQTRCCARIGNLPAFRRIECASASPDKIPTRLATKLLKPKTKKWKNNKNVGGSEDVQPGSRSRSNQPGRVNHEVKYPIQYRLGYKGRAGRFVA